MKFANAETQIHLAELLRIRARAKNPLDCDDMKYDVNVDEFPSEKDQNSPWEMITMEELDDYRPLWQTPLVTNGRISAFNNIALGTYRWKRGCQYLEHLRQYEVMENQVLKKKKLGELQIRLIRYCLILGGL